MQLFVENSASFCDISFLLPFLLCDLVLYQSLLFWYWYILSDISSYKTVEFSLFQLKHLFCILSIIVLFNTVHSNLKL